MVDLPEKQSAVQLVGPDKLIINSEKDVPEPSRHQIVCRVEAVGLCFSDLKVLKQFGSHVRKGAILSGIDPEILDEISSYVPGEMATVPGHEAVVRVVAVGEDVEKYAVGQRYLVQTDYRWLRTAGSNASFGYNFEGGLQEYVLMDERIITTPEGEPMLVDVSEKLSASAVALIEPWACVENGYATQERRGSKEDGRVLVVAEKELSSDKCRGFFDRFGKACKITWISKFDPPDMDVTIKRVDGIDAVGEEDFDDVLYFGAEAVTVERLFPKVAPGGLLNIVQCGETFERDVVTMVGRFHYGCIRMTGTCGWDPADSMERIPENGEIRSGDKIHVVGAGGPMGVMHVIRAITLGVDGISVYASDIDVERLAKLTAIAEPIAKDHGLVYQQHSAGQDECPEVFDYTVIMAPVSALVSRAVKDTAAGGIINVFAGIPADVSAEIDLNAYIEKGLYFIGTSGSVLEDMRTVLARVESGKLDTNVCVGAVCGLDGAVEGIRAIEGRSIGGKIIVYPGCKGLKLVRLEDLAGVLEEAGAAISERGWDKGAEELLLRKFGVI